MNLKTILIITLVALLAICLWSFIHGVIKGVIKMRSQPSRMKTLIFVKGIVFLICLIGIPVVASLTNGNWWNLLSILTTLFIVNELDDCGVWRNIDNFGEWFSQFAEDI